MASSHVFKGEQTILFIGRTGSGKSRLINLLAGEKIAESRQSTIATTKKCLKYNLSLNEIVYRIIDTPGFGDGELSDEEVLQQIEEFSDLNIQHINWVVVTLSCGIRLTQETARILQNIFSFLNMPKHKDHVLFCITHADGWNESAKLRYLEQLKEHSVFQVYLNDSADKFVFIGAPDPDQSADKDKAVYVNIEEAARSALFEKLSNIKAFNLQGEISKALEPNTKNKPEDRIKKERVRQFRCTIL